MSIKLSWDDVIRNPFITIHTCWEDSDEVVKSWIAQTSKIDSCLRSGGYPGNLEACIIEGEQLVQLETIADCNYTHLDVIFYIQIILKDNSFSDDNNWCGNDGFCHICNAKDQYHHALLLSITAPIIEYETNTIKSRPVVSCSRVCGIDSLKEEDIFNIDVIGYERQRRWGRLLKHMVRSTIPELNAEHGFDPAHDGADVCKYFGWPLLEFLDPSTRGE